jgi:hypothetical protein
MAVRSGSVAMVAAVLALGTGGCGRDNRAVPASCMSSAGAIATALHGAPGHVALTDGTLLSECVSRARSDADLQNLGALYTEVADALATQVPTSDRAATELGFLVGATRRAAARTNGIDGELVRRLEQAAGPDGAPAPRRAAYERGLAAGQRDG